LEKASSLSIKEGTKAALTRIFARPMYKRSSTPRITRKILLYFIWVSLLVLSDQPEIAYRQKHRCACPGAYLRIKDPVLSDKKRQEQRCAHTHKKFHDPAGHWNDRIPQSLDGRTEYIEQVQD